MFFFQSNSCAALFYAVRQFYAIAIFFMVSLDTYGVGQKLWGGCELARKATPHSFWPIALLGAKDWPWFSYNLKLKVLNVYVCSHSSWGNKPWISSFVFWPWKGSSCLSLLIYLICSMNVRQSSLSFQRTLPYIVHTTKTFNLCVLHPPSTGNICCALIFFYLFIKKILFFSK